jgi:hypothetical protein
VKINSGCRDLLRSWNAAGVPTEPRYNPERNNARLLPDAISAFGAPIAGVTPDDFTEPEIFFQIGMTSVTGLDFETAWGRRIVVDFSGVEAPVLCRADILAAKIASCAD